MSNFILATAAQTESSQLIMLPFAVLLLAAARLAVGLNRHRDRYYRLVGLCLAAVTTGYYLFGIRQPKRILHEAGDYIHFMALVGSLFVVAGGIHVQIRGRATPFFNCVLLFLGTIAGNALGTIGASMLFIRPWIRVNKYRYTGLHTAFFIFLVSNLGGGLTPMGPPLFLGYLKGVPFWWIVQHCWLAWSVALFSLLLTFYLVDRHNFRWATTIAGESESGAGKIRIDGLRNIFFFAIILGGLFVERPPFLREAVMLGGAVGSYFATPKSVHPANEFSFDPA